MNNKNLFIAIGIVAVILLVAYFAFSSPKSEYDNLVNEKADKMTDIEKEMLNKLDTVKKIKVDTSVFNSPAFRELIDYSRAIAQEPVGRANPFAPINSSFYSESNESSTDLNEQTSTTPISSYGQQDTSSASPDATFGNLRE